MGYNITLDPRPDYLHVKVTGENSPATVSSYLGDVHRACNELHCMQVLIEENLRGPSIPLSEVFGVVTEGSLNIPTGLRKIAYVDLNDQHDHALMHFAETVALNRGVNVRVFRSVPEAQSWLTEGTSVP